MTVTTSEEAATLRAFNRAMMSSPETDSIHDYLEYGIGESVSKTLSIAGNGATSQNVFQL